MTNDEREQLHIEVAKALGWKPQNDDWWISADGERKIPKYQDWAVTLNGAFRLLKGKHFDLFTCDAGYGCRIFTGPERGEELLGEAYAGTITEAICRAFIETSKSKK